MQFRVKIFEKMQKSLEKSIDILLLVCYNVYIR